MPARAKPNSILITGSLHFAGEVLAVNRLRSKNVRNESRERGSLGSARVSRAGERVLAVANFS